MQEKPYILSKKDVKAGFFIVGVFAVFWLMMVIIMFTSIPGPFKFVGIFFVAFGVFFLGLIVRKGKKFNNAAKLYQLCLNNGVAGEAVVINLQSTYHHSKNSAGYYSYEVDIEYIGVDGNPHKSNLIVDKDDLNYLTVNMKVPALIYEVYAIVNFDEVQKENSTIFNNENSQNTTNDFIYCSFCGTKNSTDASYCSSCGNKIINRGVKHVEMDDPFADDDDFYKL